MGSGEGGELFIARKPSSSSSTPFRTPSRCKEAEKGGEENGLLNLLECVSSPPSFLPPQPIGAEERGLGRRGGKGGVFHAKTKHYLLPLPASTAFPFPFPRREHASLFFFSLRRMEGEEGGGKKRTLTPF